MQRPPRPQTEFVITDQLRKESITYVQLSPVVSGGRLTSRWTGTDGDLLFEGKPYQVRREWSGSEDGAFRSFEIADASTENDGQLKVLSVDYPKTGEWISFIHAKGENPGALVRRSFTLARAAFNSPGIDELVVNGITVLK